MHESKSSPSPDRHSPLSESPPHKTNPGLPDLSSSSSGCGLRHVVDHGSQIRLLSLRPDHRESEQLDSAKDLGIALSNLKRSNSPQLCWIDLQNPSSEEIHRIDDFLQIGNDALKDCLEFGEVTKVVEKQNHAFIVTHVFSPDPENQGQPKVHEVHAFLFRNILITIHNEPIPALQGCMKRAEAGTSNGSASPTTVSELYLKLAHSFMRANDPIVEQIRATVNRIGPQAYSGDLDDGFVDQQLPALARTIFQMDTLVAEQRDRFRDLSESESPLFTDEVKKKFALLAKDAENLTEQLEQQGEHLDHFINAIRLVVSLRQNEIAIKQNDTSLKLNQGMRALAMGSAVAMPILMTTGIFGMNFTKIPFDSPWLLGVSIAGSLAASAIMIWWGIKKGWLIESDKKDS